MSQGFNFAQNHMQEFAPCCILNEIMSSSFSLRIKKFDIFQGCPGAKKFSQGATYQFAFLCGKILLRLSGNPFMCK